MVLRFGEPARALSAVSFGLMTVFMSGINMYSMALVMKVVLGWDIHFSIWVSSLTVAIYVALGGLRSAIFNEVLQFILIWAGAALLGIPLIESVLGRLLAERLVTVYETIDRPLVPVVAAMEMAGVKHNDINFLQLYDDYIIVVYLQIEDLSFCAKGDVSYYERTDFTFKGQLPIQTGGGMINCGQPSTAGGTLHIIEAVRQLQTLLYAA